MLFIKAVKKDLLTTAKGGYSELISAINSPGMV